MKGTVRAVAVAFSISFLFGCASLNHKLVMTDLDRPNDDFLVDATAPDDYPGFMAARVIFIRAAMAFTTNLLRILIR